MSSSRINYGNVSFSFLAALLAAFLLFENTAEGAAMDWLKDKVGGKKNDTQQLLQKKLSNNSNSGMTSAPLPQFFQEDVQSDLTGKNLSVMKYVEAQWLHSKKQLEASTKSIDSKIQEKKCSDMLKKLYSLFINDSRESLKNSAQAISSLEQGNKAIEDLINELNRIITAPRQETLSKLETTVIRIKDLSNNQIQKIKASVEVSEGLSALGNESFATLELIPQLSITPLDIYVQAGKTLMKQIQSNAEAQKGLMLNVQSGLEQINNGLELVVETIKSTLRFSDHFAFKQYPLINLPVPTREKLFTQVGNLKTTLRGIFNTLEIGGSQVKNAAQQYSNLVETMKVKVNDSLQYQSAVDLADGNLPQISGYALNQINGLYQRTREMITEYKRSSAKASRETTKAPPRIALESSAETSVRQASRSADNKLPLFLLGGKESRPSDFMPVARNSQQKGKTSILFTETPSESTNSAFRSHETEILEKELGSDIPYSDIAKGTGVSDFDSPVSLERKAEDGIAEFLNSIDSMPSQSAGYLSQEKKGPSENDSNDVELNKMGNDFLSGENPDTLPVFRLDEIEK
ncbi:MAG: hypothetical protein HQM10_11895 [Candidatus Riflebacteria bacterium]|nr:hypothetical protein [Candidatus Riflebacteria bacterium]